MGEEARCRVKFADKTSEGKAHLESEELLFRGTFELSIPFKNVESVEVTEGKLKVRFPQGTATFELGALAEKWARKIRHPKSLTDKLGVRPGFKVSMLGVEDKDFWKQLRERMADISEGEVRKDSDLIFFGAEEKEDLRKLADLRESIKRSGAIWVVFPRGRQQIKEIDVISMAKEAGLVDVKVAKFSETHTALKLVIPVARR